MFDAIVGVGLAAYGGIVGGLYVCQRRLLYHPCTMRPVLGDLAADGVDAVEITTADGLGLLAWYRPPSPQRPVILYLHGNGGHIGYRAERLRRLAREGYGVLLAEYRGFGGNPGQPSERGLVIDAEAAAAFLASEGIAPARTVLWGESLGSGVAIHLAATRAVAAIVLEAPFTSIAACAQRHYPFVPAAWLVRDKFDSLSRIGRIHAPLLVMHGGRDRVVPVSHGRRLLAAARAPKEGWFPPQAGHENLADFGALDVAVVFIERYLSGSTATAVAAGADFG
jgi:fermentation-respiration switch protein FrsA (DUF1100 family)